MSKKSVLVLGFGAVCVKRELVAVRTLIYRKSTVARRGVSIGNLIKIYLFFYLRFVFSAVIISARILIAVPIFTLIAIGRVGLIIVLAVILVFV